MKFDISIIMSFVTAIVMVVVSCMFQSNMSQINENQEDMKTVIECVIKMVQLNKIFFVSCTLLYFSMLWRLFFPLCEPNDFVHVYYHDQIKISEVISMILGFSILVSGSKYIHDSLKELTVNDVPKQIQTLTMYFYGFSTLVFLIAHIPLLFTYCHECKINREIEKFANEIGFDLKSESMSENGITNNQFVDLFQKHFLV